MNLDDNLFHAVVVYGYNDSYGGGSSYAVYIMDPWCSGGIGGYVMSIHSSGTIGYNMGGGGTYMEFRRALIK